MKNTTNSTPAWLKILKQLKDEAGLSERELAHCAGTTRSIVRGMMRGTDPKVRDLEHVLAVFGYELEAIPLDQPKVHLSAQKGGNDAG